MIHATVGGGYGIFLALSYSSQVFYVVWFYVGLFTLAQQWLLNSILSRSANVTLFSILTAILPDHHH